MITKIKVHGYRIYKKFTLSPNSKLNLIVGGNEAGKSTLMEAVALALTGRVNGRSASEELNPYWFNTSVVAEFVHKRRSGEREALPEIYIEIFFENRTELQSLCGAINSDVPTNACPGVSLRVLPNPEFADELEEWLKDPLPLLPVEYYMVEWRSFADEKITHRPRQLVTAIIDSRTVRSSSGLDYHLRQILSDHLDPAERASISLAYREVKASMSETALADVNKRIGELHASLHDQTIALEMDQSTRTSWEGSVTPHVNDVPFSMSGQGQQAAIKISLAMSRHSGKANFVMIEEPENHLSHTSLTTLLSRIEALASEQQQLFVTTHSAFVLNRLGLDALLLIGPDSARKISELDPDTVSYFQRLPGYDTLRMALANKIVLVEGPSDEIIFERIFKDIYGKRPMEFGIDILSMRGLALRRCLELCAALDKPVAVLRDNDGIDPTELKMPVAEWLVDGRRELFIGSVASGSTLEPQLVYHNSEARIRDILKITTAADLATWMNREKTETALRIASSDQKITPPEYIRKAAEFIYG
ncbi:Predicted ATP-dependent endonuclease of the OLD family, contains P-loop ATPase and TOPRIM domains [Modicisalibacter muralis]|uniref:Predicted ATP-dependent endonuclease of the OLD family, contains P-loop ATPase and TOPRIM domains n=1 Tax=Modicisalibacter muralis TaxID=119000 RepID=A0A1G9PW57_9GAMM|nr:AAA family ATPase [Halomonas muralis]SDM03006.1 Predicted ATP-dependent endonuclease of the OLD family, contains P-loop ATPase and TOPRIM domains [Halomonas muralis]